MIPEKITSAGPDRVQERDRGVGAEDLLADQLEDVGERLQQPDRADAVRPVAVLEAADQLALDHGQHRDDHEDDQEDHDRLDDHDPGRLGEVDVGERDHARHLLGVASGCRCPRASRSRRLGAVERVRVVGRPCPRSGTRRRGASARAARPAPGRWSVRPHRDLVAVGEPEPLGVGGRELDPLLGARKLQRGVALGDLAGPEVAVGPEPQRRRRRVGRTRRERRAGAGRRGAVADVAASEPASSAACALLPADPACRRSPRA